MSLPAWARVGAKVVAIHTFQGKANVPAGYYCKGPHPEKGGIYTIRGVREWSTGGWGLALVGFPGRVYRLDRFRPLVTLEDDMAVHFTRLLDTPAPTERERA